MLDENLPGTSCAALSIFCRPANIAAFFYRTSPDGVKHHTGVFLSQYGSNPEPVYSLQRADPSASTTRNFYAAALFDSHNPEVLYGEVLVRPGWTQLTLSADEIRRNGGVPPPPEPIQPTEFTVQLYNPDQQVTVFQKAGSWGGSTSYEFSMPQTSFRVPSASTLDRTQDDPAASAMTPKLNFVWRKESKLSKDLICHMVGKSTDNHVKKKYRDPDIPISLFRSLRELTIYEPNLYRVELEDPKGLEVVLLLAAATIKDIYLGSAHLKEVFNVSDPPRIASPAAGAGAVTNATSPVLGQNGLAAMKRKSLPRLQTSPSHHAPPPAHPGPIDPRTQWEIDAETARLRAQAEAEERLQRSQEAARRRDRERLAEEETRRLRRMVEGEEREARQRQEEIDRETERLRREYGSQAMPQPVASPPVPGPATFRPQSQPQPSQHQQLRPIYQQPGPSPQQPPRGANGLYLQSSASSGSIPVMSGANPAVAPQQRMKKKSFWGLRSVSDDGGKQLTRKPSSMW